MPTTPATPFRSILCPVDFSAHSRAALQYAAAIARASGGRLTAIFVNDPLLAAAASAAYGDQGLAQTSERELEQFVERATASARIASPLTTVAVLQGQPAREIAKAARRLRADLIVLGSQGLSGVGKWVLGSTTERVLRETRAPVLAVPLRGPRSTAKRAWPGKRIVAAIDLGSRAGRDASAAADVTRWFGAELLLVHVVEPMSGPRWLTRTLRQHDRVRLERARVALNRVRDQLDSGAALESRVLVGRVAEQVTAAAGDVGAGLVVTVLQPHNGLDHPRGSTTYRILCGSNLPVLALPGGWTL